MCVTATVTNMSNTFSILCSFMLILEPRRYQLQLISPLALSPYSSSGWDFFSFSAIFSTVTVATAVKIAEKQLPYLFFHLSPPFLLYIVYNYYLYITSKKTKKIIYFSRIFRCNSPHQLFQILHVLIAEASSQE